MNFTLATTVNWEIFVFKIFVWAAAIRKINARKFFGNEIFTARNIYGMKFFLHENLEQSVQGHSYVVSIVRDVHMKLLSVRELSS